MVGSSGTTSTAGSLEVSNSVGEVIIQTGISGSFIVTQGFQQADVEGATPIEDLLPKVNYQFFPNPVKEILNVKLESEKPLKLRIALFDLKGIQIWTAPEEVQVNGQLKTQYNLAYLAEGIYTLMITNENNQVLKSVKISKL